MGCNGPRAGSAEQIQVRRNLIQRADVPTLFDGFTILHISDMHADISQGAVRRLHARDLLDRATYDLCVLTGDYRRKPSAEFDEALEAMAHVRSHLKGPVYGVLGNHDTIRMVPGLEEIGIRMLLNECETIVRGDQRIHLAGIDDAHYYRVDNIEKAASSIPHDEFSILLSHTPQMYRQAAHANFNLLLSGHTHGGQICLPGSIPITLDSVLPRYMGSGPWKYHNMVGYTSVGVGSCIVAVRLNCPSGNHFALPTSCLTARIGLLRAVPQMKIVEDPGDQYLAYKEGARGNRNIQCAQRNGPTAGEKWKQGFRYLV